MNRNPLPKTFSIPEFPSRDSEHANVIILYMIERTGLLGIALNFKDAIPEDAPDTIKKSLEEYGIKFQSFSRPNSNEITLELIFPREVFRLDLKYQIFMSACSAVAFIVNDAEPSFFKARKFMGDFGILQHFQSGGE